MLGSVTHRQRTLLGGGLLIAGLLIALALAITLGWMATRVSRPAVLVGSGHVGDDVATLFVGDRAYGLRSSVTWTDAHGSYHAAGWPECLPRLQDVSGIRFTAETVWAGGVAGGIGSDQVTWVDCSFH